MDLLPFLCDPEKTSFDVGAKVGMYSYRLLKLSRKVIAFEPIPELHHLLSLVFKNNPKFKVNKEGLSVKPGTATIRLPIYRLGFHKYGQATIEAENPLDTKNIQEIKEFEINLGTLDKYKDELVGFIKIDVEGHELSVLKGGHNLIKKNKPTILVEIQENFVNGGVKKVAEFLEPYGYFGCFLDEKKVSPLNGFSSEKFPEVKNFIFIHKSKNIDLDEIQARLT
ncbi:MAG: FkbM family methyltransferase [Sphingomonadales bacterium]